MKKLIAIFFTMLTIISCGKGKTPEVSDGNLVSSKWTSYALDMQSVTEVLRTLEFQTESTVVFYEQAIVSGTKSNKQIGSYTLKENTIYFTNGLAAGVKDSPGMQAGIRFYDEYTLLSGVKMDDRIVVSLKVETYWKDENEKHTTREQTEEWTFTKAK